MCLNTWSLINAAYLALTNDGHRNPPPFPVIEGGPAWIRSDNYQINAKAEDEHASQEMMRGPMMQVLLEDRFKLRVHRETREGPVYVLTVAKGGPKLKPFKEGSCVPPPYLAPLPPDVSPDRLCPPPPPMEQRGPNWVMGFVGMTIDAFSRAYLAPILQLPVLDRTGISGRFDFQLEYAPDDATPAAFFPGRGDAPQDTTGGTSIFTAMQEQLGLKLESAKGPREFLVIDHVERPTEN
jgi:uncharacterized protein (TIGR03435 family)